MRLIGSELTRNPYQIVSSAWNINSKIEDDFNFDTSDYRKNLKMNLNFKRKHYEINNKYRSYFSRLVIYFFRFYKGQ